MNAGVLRRTRKRRIKQTWLNPKEKWTISVQCFHNVTWLEIHENDDFQVSAIIEKLFPLWKDFRNYLKHKRREMTNEYLIVRLRIEEDNKGAEKKSYGI